MKKHFAFETYLPLISIMTTPKRGLLIACVDLVDYLIDIGKLPSEVNELDCWLYQNCSNLFELGHVLNMCLDFGDDETRDTLLEYAFIEANKLLDDS